MCHICLGREYKGSDKKLDWIQCTSCVSWVHVHCDKTLQKEDHLKKEHYLCPFCRPGQHGQVSQHFCSSFKLMETPSGERSEVNLVA